MAPDTPEDMSLAQQKSVRALVKALNAIAARLRRETRGTCPGIRRWRTGELRWNILSFRLRSPR